MKTILASSVTIENVTLPRSLPWLHSVAVIVLKFMVIVVIAFAHGEEGEE